MPLSLSPEEVVALAIVLVWRNADSPCAPLWLAIACHNVSIPRVSPRLSLRALHVVRHNLRYPAIPSSMQWSSSSLFGERTYGTDGETRNAIARSKSRRRPSFAAETAFTGNPGRCCRSRRSPSAWAPDTSNCRRRRRHHQSGSARGRGRSCPGRPPPCAAAAIRRIRRPSGRRSSTTTTSTRISGKRGAGGERGAATNFSIAPESRVSRFAIGSVRTLSEEG